MQASYDYGDGSDGSVVFDGTSTILGLAPINGVYTLTRDIFCNNCTIKDGVVVHEAGYKITCSGAMTIGTSSPVGGTIASSSNNAALPQGSINITATGTWPTAGAASVNIGGTLSYFTYTGGGGAAGALTLTGCVMVSGSPRGTLLTGQSVQLCAVLHNNGNAGGAGSAGTGGSAGAATPAGSAGGIGAAGGAGGSGNAAGSAGSASAIGFPGQTGGTGAGGAATNAGGAAGTFTALAASKGGARNLAALECCGMCSASGFTVFGGGAGGGGGGADNADAGGGGGGSGSGVTWVASYQLANWGLIAANGGDGGAGFSTAHDAGGGGGGDGGVNIVLSRVYTGTGLVSAYGGIGGAKVLAGNVGSNGAAGVVFNITA